MRTPAPVPGIDESRGLAKMFRHFARYEFSGHSPRYELASEWLADHPELTAPLLAAPPSQRRAILYFAAVQHLLRTTAPGHPLAAYLPTLGGTRDADGDLPAALGDLVSTYRDELTEICATRTTQTNEARRAALLRPGFGRAAELAAGRPLHLIELGTSAGLLLISDRYACRYVGPDGRTETYGPNGLPATLTMTCRPRTARNSSSGSGPRRPGHPGCSPSVCSPWSRGGPARPPSRCWPVPARTVSGWSGPRRCTTIGRRLPA